MKKLISVILSIGLIASVALAQGNQRDPRTPEQIAVETKVMERYRDAIVVDTLIPGSPQSYVDPTIKGFEEMADMSIDWGFTYVSYSAAVDEIIDVTDIMADIANGRKHWLAHPEKYILIESVDDIYRAKKEGKLAVSFNFQGSNALGRNLDMVEIYYRLGVKQFAFTYNSRNFMAEGSGVEPEKDTGLSPLGIKMVKEMNRVGTIVDCSHGSDQSCIDAAKISTKPIVMSHSNPKGVFNIKRNASDGAIKAVAKSGGVISINVIGGFLSKSEKDISPEMIATHANYIKELVGAEHVSFGSDYVHDIDAALALIASNPVAWPKEMYDSKTGIPRPVINVPGAIWGVVRVLEEKYGWSEKEVRGFLGENAMRVYKANWQPQK